MGYWKFPLILIFIVLSIGFITNLPGYFHTPANYNLIMLVLAGVIFLALGSVVK